MNRVYNFSAGPSMLPLEVLEKAQKEFVCYGNTGMSVMEMSHRSKDFDDIINTAKADLKDLMHIPDNYEIIFVQGGASTQFAMIPMNLLSGSGKADFIKTGQWAKKAMEEAGRYGKVRAVASSEDKTYTYIPRTKKEDFDPEADYAYITYNNTIYGTHYTEDSLPDTGDVPLITDISSNVLAEKIDVSRFALLHAGAQKNIGPAGVTVVIIRKDMLGKALDITPTMLNYVTHVESNSLYNTPPTYGIYFAGLVFKWLKEKGGVEAMQKINEEKCKILYDYLDESDFFKGTVVPEDRSLMNAPFVLPTAELDKQFIKEATAAGFVNLAGHRTVGGMRASMYNAMPTEGVVKLVEFMKDFEVKNK